MLSPEEKKEIDQELAHSPTKQAALIELLKIVQHHKGWVSDDDLRQLAEHVGVSAADLDSVATFYNLIFRRGVGRHVILICDSISCFVTGYDSIRDYITKRLGIKLGETTPDSRFTFLPVACLGVCEHAPAMIIDRETYWNLTPELVDEIFDKYR